MAGAGPLDAQIKSGIFYEVKFQAIQVTSEVSKVAPKNSTAQSFLKAGNRGGKGQHCGGEESSQ